jgi:hypothetical protein
MLAANLKVCADIENCFSYNRRKNENNFFWLGGTAKKLFPIFRVVGAKNQTIFNP